MPIFSLQPHNSTERRLWKLSVRADPCLAEILKRKIQNMVQKGETQYCDISSEIIQRKPLKPLSENSYRLRPAD